MILLFYVENPLFPTFSNVGQSSAMWNIVVNETHSVDDW